MILLVKLSLASFRYKSVKNEDELKQTNSQNNSTKIDMEVFGVSIEYFRSADKGGLSWGSVLWRCTTGDQLFLSPKCLD